MIKAYIDPSSQVYYASFYIQGLETCSSIVRGRWFIVIKKATRQQFYGMLTGSVIIDSAQTDDHHIYDAKVMLFVSNNK